MSPILHFSFDTDERPEDAIVFSATAPDAATILEALASYYDGDNADIRVSDGRSYQEELCLSGSSPFDFFVAELRA